MLITADLKQYIWQNIELKLPEMFFKLFGLKSSELPWSFTKEKKIWLSNS